MLLLFGTESLVRHYLGWFVHLKSQWPELKDLAPRGLEMQRAKVTSKECIENNYKALKHILTKYNLYDHLEILYNVDQKGLSTRHNSPPVVLTHEISGSSVRHKNEYHCFRLCQRPGTANTSILCISRD